MAFSIISNNSTAASFAGGANGVAAQNLVYRVVVSPNWQAGDTFKFDIITASQAISAGTGRVTKTVPAMAVTLNDRVHFLSTTWWYGSDNGDATAWEQQAAGAFAINIANQWQEPENLVSLAPYQGRMAVFSNRTTQVWILDANPANIEIQQVLSNIGAYCPLGPESIGDLDVLFPSTTGIRSLRVRDSSLNAFVNDIGSPIDLNMQNAIEGLTQAQLAATCSIVEPSANRYWHYIGGLIYVLSYFPAAKIMAAWSTYTPTFFLAGVQKTFVPSKFVTYDSIVYGRVTVGNNERIVCYGGLQGLTYGNTQAIAATTWLDLKTPIERKRAVSLDFVIQGSWQFQASMDWKGVTAGGKLQNITNLPVNYPVFQLGSFSWSDDGFHVKFQATSSGSLKCVLSSLVFKYKTLNEK